MLRLLLGQSSKTTSLRFGRISERRQHAYDSLTSVAFWCDQRLVLRCEEAAAVTVQFVCKSYVTLHSFKSNQFSFSLQTIGWFRSGHQRLRWHSMWIYSIYIYHATHHPVIIFIMYMFWERLRAMKHQLREAPACCFRPPILKLALKAPSGVLPNRTPIASHCVQTWPAWVRWGAGAAELRSHR